MASAVVLYPFSKQNNMVRVNQSSDKIIRMLTLAGELVVFNLLLVLLYAVYAHYSGTYPPSYKRLMLLMSVIYGLVNLQSGMVLHHRFVKAEEIFSRIISTLFPFILISLLVLWAMRWPLFTWSFMVPFYLAVIMAVFLWRWFARQVIKRTRAAGRNQRRAVFVGPPDQVLHLIKLMAESPIDGYRFMGYFNDKPVEKVSEFGPWLGKCEEAITYLEQHPELCVEELYCTLSSKYDQLVHDILAYTENHLIRFFSIPTNFNYTNRTMSMEILAGLPVFSLHNEPLAFVGNRWLKRAFDIFLSLGVIVFIFPIVLLVFGPLIKLSSPGPIFFRQKRSGLNGRVFYCLKFRSMRMNAECDKLQATRNDPRKTRVGEFMRRTNIDELPQFINVLIGDMSVVGPRPHMLEHTKIYSDLIGNYMLRHFVKPGITGFAQVTGFRGETRELWQMQERVRRDIYYVEHWTFAFDLWIIFRTIVNFGESKAY